MSTPQIVAVAVGGAIVLIALIFLMVKFAVSAFGKSGGMGALAARYHTSAEVEGQRFERQSIQVGALRWMRCVTVAVSTRGLWLHPRPPFVKLTALLIPWSDIRAGDRTRINGLRAMKLEIGSPPITTLAVGDELFAALKPHLR